MKRLLSIVLMILICSTSSQFAISYEGVQVITDEDANWLNQDVQESIRIDILQDKEGIMTPDFVILEEEVPKSAPVLAQGFNRLMMKESFMTPDLVILEEEVPKSAPVIDQEMNRLLMKELLLTSD